LNVINEDEELEYERQKEEKIEKLEREAMLNMLQEKEI
jgi:hypothetical protein